MVDYLHKLEKVLSNKKLDNFWVLCSSDIKAIKKSKTEIKKMLKDDSNKYKNKKIANIELYTNPNGIEKQSWIFGIKITIYEIDENGQIDTTSNSVWGVYIKYSETELKNNKFKLNELEKLVKKTADKKLTSSLIAGINFSDLFL